MVLFVCFYTNFANNGFIFISLINPPNPVTPLVSKIKGQMVMEQYSFDVVFFYSKTA
jgi:hypothetical protein